MSILSDLDDNNPVQEVQLHELHLHPGELLGYTSQNLNLHCREKNLKDE